MNYEAFFFPPSYPFAQALAIFIVGVIIGVLSTLVIAINWITPWEKNMFEAEMAERKAKLALEEKVSEALRWLIVQEIVIR